jgi:hypothetical protein
MKKNVFLKEINAAWDILDSSFSLGRAFICNASLGVDEEFRRAALDEESSYDHIYRLGLSRSHYNLILHDYSYFQYSWISECDFRLAYYPNPRITGLVGAEQKLEELQLLEETGQLSVEEVGDFLSDMPYLAAVPPIRFEYQTESYKEFCHPAAHFHIGRCGRNRWPSSVVVGPKSFTLLIAKLYYSESWQNKSSYANAAAEGCVEKLLVKTLENTKPTTNFSLLERRSLHFSKT